MKKKFTWDPRDAHGHRLRDTGFGAMSLDILGPDGDGTPFIDRLTEDLCTRRQEQIEADSILIEDLRHCGLSQNESRVLGLLVAGWNMTEAAGIMRVSRKTVQRATRSMQVKIRPLLDHT